METLQNLVIALGSLASMGAIQIGVVLLLIGLVFIWLIVRASRKENRQDRSSAKTEHRQPHRSEPAAEAPKTQTQFGFLEQPATPQIKSDKETHPATADISQAVINLTEQLRQSASHSASLSDMPQDSVLSRHYQTELAAKKQALSNPYPSDSVLRRHYDALHKIAVESAPALGAVNPVAQHVLKSSLPANSTQKASIIEQAIRKEGQAVAVVGLKSATISVPQDSVLKRHFISKLRAEIESSLPPKPCDSVLSRHYDGMVRSELEKRLAG